MKRLVFKLLIPVFFLAIANGAIAKKREDIEKRKKIEKTYKLNDQQVFDISNKFGQVHVNTWDKNQLDVNVEIIARGRSQERAQDLLDKIEISIVTGGNLIKFETVLKGNINNKNSESFEINYLVNMPKANPMNLKNSFGETYLADFAGKLNMDVSYGDIKAGRLTGASEVKISFGDGEIDQLKSGGLTVKYSDVEVEELGDVKLDFGYSDVSVEKAGNLDLTLKYGDFDVEELISVNGSVGFSKFTAEKLFRSIDMETSYSGGFEIEQVSKEFEKINLKGKFGSFKIGLEQGTNCTFETKLKFCNLNYSGLDVDLTYKMKEDFKSGYKGKIGKGGGGTIFIESSYGDVKLHQE